MVEHSANNFPDGSYLPEVVVIVPIYNGEDDLPDLINCIRAQTYPRDRVEYLLVDNASRDRTAEIIKTAAQDATDGLSIRYLAENKIQSSYAARNAGIRATATDVIVFTDVDCRPKPNWLYEMVQPFADPDVGIVGGAVEGLPGTTLLEEYARKTGTLSHKHAHNFDPPFAPGANLAIRRQAFKEVGLFRPYLTTSGDIDISWRIVKSGSWKFFSAEKAVIQHRHRKNLKELHKQWRRYGHAFKYTFQLHNIAVAGDGYKTQQLARMWLGWLIKDMPRNTLKLAFGKTTLLDWLDKPIRLFQNTARAQGRDEAKLTEQMCQIEWL